MVITTAPRKRMMGGQNQGLLAGLSFGNPTTNFKDGDQPVFFTPMCNKYYHGLLYHNIKKKCFFFDTLTGTLDNSLFSDKDRFAVQSLSHIWCHGLQHARLPCPALSSGVCSNSCLVSWWCHPVISSSISPFYSCPQPFQNQGLFQWVGASHQVAKVLEFQLQHQSFQYSLDFL